MVLYYDGSIEKRISGVKKTVVKYHKKNKCATMNEKGNAHQFKNYQKDYPDRHYRKDHSH